jgi:hypothetical protein
MQFSKLLFINSNFFFLKERKVLGFNKDHINYNNNGNPTHNRIFTLSLDQYINLIFLQHIFSHPMQEFSKKILIYFTAEVQDNAFKVKYLG